jgi:hypothetical protein
MQNDRALIMGRISLKCTVLGLVLPIIPAALAGFITGISWGSRSKEAGVYYCIAIFLFVTLQLTAVFLGAIARSTVQGKIALALSTVSLCLAINFAFFFFP